MLNIDCKLSNLFDARLRNKMKIHLKISSHNVLLRIKSVNVLFNIILGV